MDADELDEFIGTSSVDDRAADALRQAAVEVQRAVVARGSLSGARNPSSVLLARIRDASAPASMPNVPGAGYVRLRGLPYSASVDDILVFFEGFAISREGIILGMNRDGRPSGEAFVQFPSEELAADAMKDKNRDKIGDRYIELFESFPAEVHRGAPGRGDAFGNIEAARGRGCTPEDVDEFLHANEVDERAAEALRTCDPFTQRMVIDRGNLASARNPSSVLLGRIRDVQNGGDGSCTANAHAGMVGGPHDGGESRKRPRGDLDNQVEELIAFYCIEERVADTFRAAPAATKEEVLRKGVRGARNPSAALLARVKDCELASASGTGNGFNRVDSGDDRDESKGSFSGNGCYGGGSGGYGFAPPERGGFASQPVASEAHMRPTGLMEAVESFIERNNVDSIAADALRNAHLRTQECVLDGGELRNVQNPSSALMTRIKDANAHFGVPGPGVRASNASGHIDVEEFIRSNDVDDRSADCLRDLPQAMQQDVVSRGSLANARNPSSVLLSRIRDVRSSSHHSPVPLDGRGPGGPPAAWHQDARGNFSTPSASARTSPGLLDEVEDLIRFENVDDRAADSLRTSDAEVQKLVVKRGIRGARHPSSALLARIKDATAEVQAKYGSSSGDGAGAGPGVEPVLRPSPGPGPVPSSCGDGSAKRSSRLSDDIDQFVRINDIDSRAADSLRECALHVQEEILERGDFRTARNPSSALMALIKEVQGRRAGPPRPRSSDANAFRTGDLQRDIAEFLSANVVDDRAADALRDSVPYVQEWVLERGSLGNARNPSSVLLSRIRDATAEMPADIRPPFEWGQPSGSSRQRDWAGPSGGVGRTDLAEAVEHFIVANGVDTMAANALRNCSPAAQDYVVERGDMRNAQNPSSALLARIKEANANIPGSGSFRRSTDVDVEEFIKSYDLDDRSVDALRDLPADAQEDVLSRGSLANARNPSSVLLSRIRDAVTKAGGSHGAKHANNDAGPPRSDTRHGGGTSRIADEVEDFIRSSDVDENAAEALRACDPQMQEHVLNKGIHGARNPSSALLARIRDAKTAAAQPDRGPQRGPVSGDLNVFPHDVEEFITRNDIDERASELLRSSPKMVQEYVLERADLRTARNPSSALMALIKEAPGYTPHVGGGGGSFAPSQQVHPDVIPTTPRSSLPDEVEDFVAKCDLDDRAAEALRRCSPTVQQVTIDRGVIEGARNPSALLLSRIREIQNSMIGGGYDKLADIQREVEDFIAANGLDGKAADSLRGCPPRVQKVVIERGSVTGARSPESVIMARIRDASAPHMGDASTLPNIPGAGYVRLRGVPFSATRQDIQDFFRDYQVHNDGVLMVLNKDGKATGEAFVQFPNEDQASDALHARHGDRIGERYIELFASTLGEAQRATCPVEGSQSASYDNRQVGGGSGYYASAGPRAPLSGGAPGFGGALPTSGHGFGAYVNMSSGGSYGMTNGGCGGGYGSYGVAQRDPFAPRSDGSRYEDDDHNQNRRLAEDVEAFIRSHDLDISASDALRHSEPRVQELVLDRGIKGARNPSSALLARIRDAKSPPRGDGRSQRGGSRDRRSKLQDDVERFIRNEDLDRAAADALRRCEPGIQEALLDRGLRGARNPSSALLARIRDMKAERHSGRGGSGYGRSRSRGRH
eukprot:TRINITY_DN24990_c0_g1_i1.p1 TRINITY_DN24990_c0_g1~~TRINITY_DN24990_c0_g1_i1.p1  ORF type:complete len:1638 (-),score=319.69 TRINITY_DN24990_c0_g1_i1:93-5006(-)